MMKRKVERKRKKKKKEEISLQSLEGFSSNSSTFSVNLTFIS